MKLSKGLLFFCAFLGLGSVASAQCIKLRIYPIVYSDNPEMTAKALEIASAIKDNANCEMGAVVSAPENVMKTAIITRSAPPYKWTYNTVVVQVSTDRGSLQECGVLKTLPEAFGTHNVVVRCGYGKTKLTVEQTVEVHVVK